MKRTLSFLTVAAFILVLATPSFAASAMPKFKDGVKSIAMSPLQVRDHVQAETKDAKFLPFALVGGLLKGSFYMGKNIVTGAVDVVTSPMELMK